MQTQGPLRRARGLILLAVAAGLCLHTALRPKAPAHGISQEVINHITDAAEPLCRTLVPNKNVLHFAVHRSPAFHRNGSARDLWVVECLDEKGKEIVHILWDEDNKRCISISRMIDEATRNYAPLLNKDDALSAARAWVARLNMANAAQAAGAPGKLRDFETSWQVFLRLPDGMASVWVNARTGEIYGASMRNYPDMSAMQAAAPPPEVPHS